MVIDELSAARAAEAECRERLADLVADHHRTSTEAGRLLDRSRLPDATAEAAEAARRQAARADALEAEIEKLRVELRALEGRVALLEAEEDGA